MAKQPSVHVRLVLVAPAVQTYPGLPAVPVQAIVVAPMTARSLLPGSVRGVEYVAVPAGTPIVSPETAAFTQSRTSAREALAATRFGLAPPQAARAVAGASRSTASPATSMSAWWSLGVSASQLPPAHRHRRRVWGSAQGRPPGRASRRNCSGVMVWTTGTSALIVTR